VKWIGASARFPVIKTAPAIVSHAMANDAHWREAFALAGNSRQEPMLSSWLTVRWALSDAVKAMLRSDFPENKIQALLQELESTSGEIQSQH